MRLNRRGFLGALLGAAAADPERLLWVPGAKLISIPAPAPLRYGFPWRYDGIVLTTTAIPNDVARWIRARFLMQVEAIEAAPRETWIETPRC